MWLELKLYHSPGFARTIHRVPGLRFLLERRYARLFARSPSVSLFRGTFKTFDEARRSAPDTERLGYNLTAAARMYDSRLDRVFLNDYPMLFWLARVLKPDASIFDLGGHVGLSYYAYAKYLEYPENVCWRICDVPAVVEAGRELARERRARGLSFTERVEDVEGADVLCASGSLQYIETSLETILQQVSGKPRHLLLNRLPLYDGDSFVTLQGIGVTFCPYRVFSRCAFVETLDQLGYEVVDSWENAELSMRIPFDSSHVVTAYSGLYLRLREPTAAASHPVV
jgi:putative methyltransferase (TIGR04325 family)